MQKSRTARTRPSDLSERSDSAVRPSQRRRWIEAGVVVAVAPLGVAVVRILLFTGGDPGLFFTLIDTLDLQALVLSSVVYFVPYLALFTLAFIFAWDASLGRVRWTNPVDYLPLLVAVVMGILVIIIADQAFMLEAIWAVIGVLTGLLIGLTALFLDRNGLTTYAAVGRGVLPICGIAVAVPFALILLAGAPWGAYERIEVRLPDAKMLSLSAIVLDSESTWTTLLGADRTIRVVLTEDVLSRSICNQGRWNSPITRTWEVRPGVEEPPDC